MADPTKRVPLSVLDLVPVSHGMTDQEAFASSLDLARDADRLGFHRLWMAEHHGSDAFLSSATSLLLGRAAEHTSRIRLGSGGVMLPNHAPLMVAEYYGTLASIYGDRIDLGLGRAPGTDPMTAAALRRGTGELDTFARDVLDLVHYLGPREARPEKPGQVRALPGEGTEVPIWMLGSSTGGAQVAAALGLPFSFASHFSGPGMDTALRVYRERFTPDAPTAQVDRPTVMAGANVIVADTMAEAERLHTTSALMTVRLRTGQIAPLDPPVDKLADVLPPQLLDVAPDPHGFARFVGTPETVVAELEEFVAVHDLDEVITVTYTHDPAARRRSFELLADAWGLPVATQPASSHA